MLHLEDDFEDAELIRTALKEGGLNFTIRRVISRPTFIEALKHETYDLILGDFYLPDFDGLLAFQIARSLSPDIPFISLSGGMQPEQLIHLLKDGVSNHIGKDHLDHLAPAIRQALSEAQTAKKIREEGAQLHRLAYYNDAIGLPNKNLFLKWLNEAMTQKKSDRFLLFQINLNRLKEINRTVGHPIGDLVLQEAGRRLLAALGKPSRVAHGGGGLFFILCADETDLTIGKRWANHLQRLLEEPMTLAGLPLFISATIGIARFPDDGATPEALLSCADLALSTAKASGEGYDFYNSEKHAIVLKDVKRMGELSRALDREELVLFYQPKIEIASMEITGVEALLRWNHPELGLLAPMEFIPLAERTNLISLVTIHLLHMVLKQFKHWQEGGYQIPISVNLSMKNVQSLTFINQVTELLLNDQTAPEGSRSPKQTPPLLEWEIPESVLMSNVAQAMENMKQFPEWVRSLTIDDFGTECVALHRLKESLVKKIKIDRHFVAGVSKRDGEGMLVSSVIDLAHRLGLTVVAEGVEDQKTLDMLQIMGCDEAQGFYIAKPMPSEEILLWIKAAPWGETRLHPNQTKKRK